MTSTDPRLLQAVGVSAEDELIYRALLRHPRTTLAELARTTGRSVPSLRRAVPRLEQLGLVSRVPGQPPQLVATRPNIAVEALVSRRQEELAQARIAAATLMAELPADEHHRSGDLVTIVHGQQAVAAQFIQLQQGATAEIMVLDRPPYAQDPQAPNPGELEVLRRGVVVRGIYAAEALELPGMLTHTHEAVAAGEQARVGVVVPTKLAIADRRLAILPLTSDQQVDSALIVHSSSLLDTLVALFELLWRTGLPLPGLSTVDDAGPDPDLMTLLIAGLKDEAVARQLGVSLRTVHRRTSTLMAELNARTRFQAGVLASHRGWAPTAAVAPDRS
jgi:sugar-specific transcriptional regulator TrmB